MLRLMTKTAAARQRGARDDQQHDRDLHRRAICPARCWASWTQIRDAPGEKRRQAQHRRGGRRHAPFQQWHERRITTKPRFRELSELYGYLSKQFTILASMFT